MAPDSIDIMYGFAMLEGVEISVTTAHSLGDELSANVESCFCCSVLGGVGKKTTNLSQHFHVRANNHYNSVTKTDSCKRTRACTLT